MGTQIIDLNNGTQIITDGFAPQLAGGSTTETGVNFTGGLLQIHERIAGWEIISKLSTISGEADIYIAEKDGEKSIIKYYRDITKPKTEILEKLKNLNHPDIINLFEFGYHNERFYEIMEYAEGGSLDTREVDGSYRYLPLSEHEVEGICEEIINSYKTCHENGIIHRDIKPANIYYRTLQTEEIEAENGIRKIYKGNDIVIADFGISSISDEIEELHKTRTGSRTTGYAAPEVLSGIISHKMDYYALGITLWEFLTGKDPFTLDNGKRRNDAHLIRDTIEGRIADDILSKEPRLNQKMERLIRGLLVVDPEHRWGLDEVTRHLAGENVDVYQKSKKTWTFSIDNTECTSIEALGSAIMNNPEASKRYIFRGLLTSFLEDDYNDLAKNIEQISEESSAANDLDNGILKVAYLLNPALPLNVDNGFKFQNLDELSFLLENAPESIIPLLRDENSKLYTWLEIMGYSDIANEVKKLLDNIGNAELAGKADVLIRRKVIKPFKLAKYADFELSTLEQLRKIPKDMQKRIVTLVKEKSYEGLFFPWLSLLTPNGVDYSYILQTKYLGAVSTSVSDSDNLPLSKIGKFNISVSNENADNYEVSWDIEHENIDIRVFVNKNMVIELKTDKSSCVIELPRNGFHIVEAHVFSEDNWLPCEENVQVNTWKPCEIDETRSKYIKDAPNSSGNNSVELSIKMIDNIPDNITAFWYLIRSKNNFKESELTKAPDIKKITIDIYKRADEILYNGTYKDEDTLYVTMFSVYNIDGKEIISMPYRHYFIRNLNADVFWKVSKPLIGCMKLSIDVKPNRSMSRLPKFILCASSQDQLLKSYTDEDAIVLLEIPEREFDSPKAIFKGEFAVNREAPKISRNQKVYLFKIARSENENYSLKWADGFSGKV